MSLPMQVSANREYKCTREHKDHGGNAKASHWLHPMAPFQPADYPIGPNT